MSFRISPLWWPVLAAASPVLVPLLVRRNGRFKKNQVLAAQNNRERMIRANHLNLPELDSMKLTVLVEAKARQGFIGDAGVSYLFETDRGRMLFDIGFGATRPAFNHNAARLGITLDQVEALAISHLHCDHIGGVSAQRSRKVMVPKEFMPSRRIPCFLPDKAEAPGFIPKVIDTPRMTSAGIASTGPLSRSLFFFGYTEEQALLADIRGKGLVVFTGCGHPTIEVILDMVRHLSNEPLYAVGGGLHFPVTDGRGNQAGLRLQMIMGTGKPPWRRITDQELGRTIQAINTAAPRKVFLSAHDTCDHALDRMKRELQASTEVLTAGSVYDLGAA
jgi:7,8-dihydropterin-6-yl-methyl-4-(beta-D-ribofuranosyl)aminobenzene 5'-phosphate synthase